MTIYTDAATISTKTTPSGVDALYQDDVIVSSITEISPTEVSAYIDSATIESFTSLTGSYISETFTIHTTDYNWSPWSISYTFDGSIPVYGCVGAFNDDTGVLA